MAPINDTQQSNIQINIFLFSAMPAPLRAKAGVSHTATVTQWSLPTEEHSTFVNTTPAFVLSNPDSIGSSFQ